MKAPEFGENNVGPTEPPSAEGGREAVPVEAALDAQRNLITYMIPTELRSRLYIDDEDPVFNALAVHFMDKYNNDEFNGFAEYCDLHADDKGFMERVIHQRLTEEDFQSIRNYLIESSKGGAFFTPEELTEFIDKNII